MELRTRRIEGGHRTDYCTQPQDRGTMRSIDTDRNYTESTGIGSNYTDNIDTANIRHTGIASNYMDSIGTASIRHNHIDT